MYIRTKVYSIFFFQAEDGIRDLVRSRGLGDVYKRQAIHRGVGTQAERDAALPNPSKGDEWFNTDLAGGGKWEKHTGTDWKRS